MNILMKKTFIVLILSALLVSSFYSTHAIAQCTARTIIKECKSKFVDPYKYSGCWMKEFVLDHKYKRIEGHFVVLEGLQYQILFCSSGSAESVTINIYDKSMDAGKKRKLYDSSKNQGANMWKFEPTVSGDYYVEYIIPPSQTGEPQTGCLMLMVGTIIETGEETETGQEVDPNKIIRKSQPKK